LGEERVREQLEVVAGRARAGRPPTRAADARPRRPAVH
jgi:hypothetical protein